MQTGAAAGGLSAGVSDRGIRLRDSHGSHGGTINALLLYAVASAGRAGLSRDRQRLRRGAGGQDAPAVAKGLTIGQGDYPAASVERLCPGTEPDLNVVVVIKPLSSRGKASSSDSPRKKSLDSGGRLYGRCSSADTSTTSPPGPASR